MKTIKKSKKPKTSEIINKTTLTIFNFSRIAYLISLTTKQNTLNTILKYKCFHLCAIIYNVHTYAVYMTLVTKNRKHFIGSPGKPVGMRMSAHTHMTVCMHVI